jgi:hypothetical protein
MFVADLGEMLLAELTQVPDPGGERLVPTSAASDGMASWRPRLRPADRLRLSA